MDDYIRCWRPWATVKWQARRGDDQLPNCTYGIEFYLTRPRFQKYLDIGNTLTTRDSTIGKERTFRLGGYQQQECDVTCSRTVHLNLSRLSPPCCPMQVSHQSNRWQQATIRTRKESRSGARINGRLQDYRVSVQHLNLAGQHHLNLARPVPTVTKTVGNNQT